MSFRTFYRMYSARQGLNCNDTISMYKENQFVFSAKYRLLRHLIFWLADAFIFTFIFKASNLSVGMQLVLSLCWTPLHMVYAYPIMYLFIPRFLLKEKTAQFILIILLWAVVGWYWNYICRTYMYFSVYTLVTGIPVPTSAQNHWAPNSYLAILLPGGIGSAIVLFKHWMKKQREFLLSEKEKINAELQLLKAQIHPHFLFNTLNNIYSFSLKGSQKTSAMVAKLSSLLSYVLYDGKNSEVLLEKEIEVMKNYIDLEKERYGNKLEISINAEGDIQGKYISPLLLLPFIENAFKHGTSEQLDRPWFSMDLSVKDYTLRCKILNSKNETIFSEHKGIGIENVRKRLGYLYPKRHELKLNDEGDFFAVSLMIVLDTVSIVANKPGLQVESQFQNLLA
jgi:two-component system, LytTR family, sensor histidine kinase AlgZ